MKKMYILFIAILISSYGYSQCSVSVTNSTNVSCFGVCDGTASLLSIGTAPFTYSWSPGGQTLQNPNDLCAGTHTVTMIDANSCVATTTVTITEPDLLTDSTVLVHTTCNGDCDGSIDLFPYGGTAPYTFSWSPNSETTEDISSLCAGTYSVLITDANSCTTQDAITIMEPAVLAVGVTANLGCGSNCDKSGIAAPTGGTAPYTYDWAPGGQTTQIATGLCAGTFQVNVVDTNGCSAMGIVTITNPTVLGVSTSSTDESCVGCADGTTTSTPTGGTPPYSYSWSPGGCNTASCTGLAPGTYTLTVTDANGCTTSSSETINSFLNVEESIYFNKVNFYPNPFTNNLSINIEMLSYSQLNLSISNVIGELIYSDTYSGQIFMKQINLNQLDAGIYFINLKINEEIISKKIIKL